jgi:hypothetical protein
MHALLGNNRILVVIGGGVFLIVAASLMARVEDRAGYSTAPATASEAASPCEL